VDRIFKAKMFKLVSAGFAANLPNPVLHQFHRADDGNGEGKLDISAFFANATFWEYVRYGRLKQLGGKPDQPFWGWPKRHFTEIYM
jgi:hypothetical protein